MTVRCAIVALAAFSLAACISAPNRDTELALPPKPNADGTLMIAHFIPPGDDRAAVTKMDFHLMQKPGWCPVGETDESFRRFDRYLAAHTWPHWSRWTLYETPPEGAPGRITVEETQSDERTVMLRVHYVIKTLDNSDRSIDESVRVIVGKREAIVLKNSATLLIEWKPAPRNI